MRPHCSVPGVDEAEAWPLSSGQERIWFAVQAAGKPDLYRIGAALHLSGPLDFSLLLASLRQLIERHESLRTRYFLSGRGPLQRVEEPYEPNVALFEGAEFVGYTEPALCRVLFERMSRATDPLTDGRMLSACVVKQADEEHILLVCIHHIAADGWSLNLLLNEFRSIYAAGVKGQVASLKEPSGRYVSFAKSQREIVESGALDELALDLATAITAEPLGRLQHDRNCQRLLVAPAKTLKATLSEKSADALANYASTQNVHVSTVLLFALSAAVRSQCDNDRIAVGLTQANRRSIALARTTGFFVSIGLLVVSCSDEEEIATVMRRMQDDLKSMQKHREVPFELVAKHLRDRGIEEAFQVLFNYLPFAFDKAGFGPMSAKRISLDDVLLDVEMSVTVEREEQGFHIKCSYLPGLYAESTAKRILDRYVAILTQLGESAPNVVRELTLIPSEERKEILEWSSGPEVKQPSQRCLHDLVWERAAEAPDAVALVYRDEQMSYGEMVAAAGRVARRLRARGVGPEVVVGVCAERSPAVIVALLGILKAGGAYLPLDPDLPKERIAFMLNDARSALVLASDATAECLPAEVQRLPLDGGDDPLAAPDTPPSVHPANLAYVIYTSGSTGKPKGVMVPHEGAANLVNQMAELALQRHDTVLQFAPLSFDASIFEIWVSLSYGARVALHPERIFSLDSLEQWVRRYGVTVALFTSGVFAAIAKERPSTFAPLHTVLAGGDVVTVEATKSALLAMRQGRVVNVYGPTETVVFCTTHHESDPDRLRQSIPIGRPLAASTAHILDARGRVVPFGAIGELYVGGTGLARGYISRPALTAQTFLPDPFGKQPGARLYRTGDIVRINAEKTLEFLGRADDQIKLRGFRVEPGEVAAALSEHDAVREAIVTVDDSISGHKQLVAYLCMDDQATTADDLKRYLATKVPSYMVPETYIHVAEVPLTPNGKVDRAALRGCGRVIRQTGLEEIVADEERRLAALWRDVLGVQPRSRHDDFFECGGDSISAAHLSARVGTVLGGELPVSAIFSERTLSGMAASIQYTEPLCADSDPAQTRAEGAEISARDRRAEVPLGPSQGRFWFLQQVAPDSTAYNIPLKVTLGPSIQLQRLSDAIAEVIVRHEALRTYFPTAGGRVVQRVVSADDVRIATADFLGQGESEAAAWIERATTDAVTRRFDLASAVPLTIEVARLPKGGGCIVMAMHHILADGWSVAIFVRDLEEIYQSRIDGREPNLPPLPVQYPDYAVWAAGSQTEENLEQGLRYWEEYLRKAPTHLRWPGKEQKTAYARDGDQCTVLVPEHEAQGIRQLAQDSSTTMFTVLLSALNATLFFCTGQPDFVVGAVIGNRTLEALYNVVGCFVNFLPLRTRLDESHSFGALIEQTHRSMTAAYRYQAVPLEHIARRVRKGSRSAELYNVAFLLQNFPHDSKARAFSVDVAAIPNHTAKLDMRFTVWDRPDGIHIECEYDTDLFSASEAEAILSMFARIAGACGSGGQLTLREIRESIGVDALPSDGVVSDEELDDQAVALLQTLMGDHTSHTKECNAD